METTSISFSSEVKAELCALPLGDKAGALAECYGILLYSNTFTTREIRMVTGNRALMQRLPRLFKKAFGLEFDQVTGGEDNKKGIFRCLGGAGSAGGISAGRVFGGWQRDRPGKTVPLRAGDQSL